MGGRQTVWKSLQHFASVSASPRMAMAPTPAPATSSGPGPIVEGVFGTVGFQPRLTSPALTDPPRSPPQPSTNPPP